MWHPKYSLLQWLWNLVVVSISAQLTTLPLSLLYFKQFPTYFLLANLFAIPFATIFLPGNLVFICTYFLDPLNRVTAVLLDHTGRFFIQIIGIIHGLPGSLISSIKIGTLEAFLILIMISLLYMIFRFREYRLFRYILTLLGILIVKDAFNYFNSSGVKKILSYSIAGSPVIELVDGHQSLILLQNPDRRLSEKVRYHTGNYHLLHNLKSRIILITDLAQFIPCDERERFLLICWNGKSIGIMDSTLELNSGNLSTSPLDFVFAKKNNRYEPRKPGLESLMKKERNIPLLHKIFIKEEKPLIESTPGLTSITF
jgi:competence protein ComEC